MTYKIRTFDATTGIISVEYQTGEYISFPLPVNSSGMAPTGAELDEIVQKIKPQTIILQINNADQIQNLVEPMPLIAPDWLSVRKTRQQLLLESDWTQLPDVPLTAEQKGVWANYRQQLRDITTSFSQPELVIWPEPPV